MKNFEEYINFIEYALDTPLLDWQKEALRGIYNGCCPYVYGVRNGKMMMYRAALILKEEMARDSGCLPARLYGLDGYTTDNVIYDECKKEK